MKDNLLTKYYKDLELPYTATIEEVEARRKAFVKIIKDEEQQKSISLQHEIVEVNTAADAIVENLRKNGCPEGEYHTFDASKQSLMSLFVAFAVSLLICLITFLVI